MLRGFLVSEKDIQGPRRVPIHTSIVLGRAADCGFVLDDAAASRRHLQIVDRGGDFHWKDLGSTNGTVVNGARMLEGRLKSGDRLQIGDTVLRFELEEIPAEVRSPDDSTMFRQVVFDEQGEAITRTLSGRAEALLRAVYSVMDEIASNYETCSLVDRILETTVQAVDAQRGALFFTDPSGEALLPCPVCEEVHVFEDGALTRTAVNELQISSTIAQRVLKDGESVLFKSADSEGRDSSASIVSLKLRSVICTPLRGKLGSLGILYLDSNRRDREYSEDDMLLATAVGKSAGLAIENANMHRQLLEKQRIEQEISFAWSIQQGFLVKTWPDAEPSFQVYGETRPAKTVGGDFYDFARPDADHLGLLIGDVSGKGVPAALTMAQLLAEFRLHARGVCEPARVLHALNRGLAARSRHGMFCTLCYICLDLRTGEALCANAGHHPPIVVGADGARLACEATGPPAGILGEAEWEDTPFRLAPGESVLLYTDGIVEARKANTPVLCEYGSDALCLAAAKFYGKHPKDLLDSVNDEVVRFCAPAHPHDDCTMIAARYCG